MCCDRVVEEFYADRMAVPVKVSTEGDSADVFSFSVNSVIPSLVLGIIYFFVKEIYCTESIHEVHKDKLQNFSCNHFQ